MNEPPEEIIKAASVLSDWMKREGHSLWQFMGVCDREFAFRLEQALHQNKQLGAQIAFYKKQQESILQSRDPKIIDITTIKKP